MIFLNFLVYVDNAWRDNKIKTLVTITSTWAEIWNQNLPITKKSITQWLISSWAEIWTPNLPIMKKSITQCYGGIWRHNTGNDRTDAHCWTRLV